MHYLLTSSRTLSGYPYIEKMVMMYFQTVPMVFSSIHPCFPLLPFHDRIRAILRRAVNA